MRKIIQAAALLALLLTLTGCNAADQAFQRINEEKQAAKLDSPSQVNSGIDWSYVPVVRDRSVSLFTEAFPDAEVTQTSVASKNGKGKRVIVTLTYRRNGKTATYGFDYTRNEQGEYDLTRYGDGVDSDDL